MSTWEASNPYLPPAGETEYEDAYEEPSLPEDYHVFPWKLWAFLSVPLMEIIAQCVFTTDGERAILVAPAFGLAMFLAIFDLILQARNRHTFHSEGMKMWFLTGIWLGGLGLFAIAMAVGWKNEMYYVAADIFHWYFEFVGVGFLAVWAFSSYSSHVIARAVSRACFWMALIGLTIVALGILGKLQAGYGGKPVEGVFRWRLELGRAYPIVPLIISIALLFYAPRTSGKVPLLTLTTVLMFIVCLIFTLKRTQWLLFPVCAVGLFIPKRAFNYLPFFALLGGTMLWGFHILSPNAIPNAIEDLKQFVTYNEEWTVDQTLDTRDMQVKEAFRVSFKEWWGHGFGAEIYIITPNGKRTEALHYVHSLYAYYALQFGLPGGVVAIGVFLAVVLGLYLVMDINPAAQWMVRSALFSIVALAGSGLMMVSIHTALAGVVLGIAVVALARCYHPHMLDEYHSPAEQEDYDDSYEHEEEVDSPELAADEDLPDAEPKKLPGATPTRLH
jgi:hypothetical protein